jgi:hypothetical protein
VSAAVFLAYWLGKRQSRKAAASVEEAKPDPKKVVLGGMIKKGDDDSSNNSGSSVTLGSSILGRPSEMEATSPTPSKTVSVVTSTELADDKTAAEQRPIRATQHRLAHTNAERQAQLVAACDRMQRKLEVARNRRSGIIGGAAELEDRRRSLTPTPAPRAELADLDGMRAPRRASRITDVDVGVPVELMGSERLEKG